MTHQPGVYMPLRALFLVSNVLHKLWYNQGEIKRIHHRCSVGTGKSQPEGPPFQWETRLRRVSHWSGGPEGRDLPVPLYTNDRFYFSHI